ncbi:hypothetical protein H6G00_14665 [Leptolyngbya sp. FACHB-541]|uniref:hypothetical protein n=1 Tax=Leptolyngbya sp. FACHB-541 TaxID=2692810 RepID=UPI001685CD51|nr:hypothetical protein [Leptolyngbya sp. FACHB-541]MBD1997852.1 hypothetical protein [Leptolyngbya sp. FACHB-541]
MQRLNLGVSLLFALILGPSVVPAAAQTPHSEEHPTVGTVESVASDDVLCYLTIVDDEGDRYENVGATFDVCAEQDRFLNQRASLEYRQVRVSGCQGAEPCAVTRLETVVAEVNILPVTPY